MKLFLFLIMLLLVTAIVFSDDADARARSRSHSRRTPIAQLTPEIPGGDCIILNGEKICIE